MAVQYLWTAFDGPYHDELITLRIEVFVREQKVPFEEELDALDLDANHLIAIGQGGVVGVLRVLKFADYMKIGRLAVKKPFRHKGIATKLMEVAMDFVEKQGAKKIVLDSQTTVIPFYERLGFHRVGEEFMDAGIPHMKMEKMLTD